MLGYLKQEVGTNAAILVMAILLDLIMLGGFLWVKLVTDPVVIGVAAIDMAVILFVESVFLANRHTPTDDSRHHHGH
ncbi:MAG: hypothetical protein ACQERE_05605 [Pseudomonadota bacterium]